MRLQETCGGKVGCQRWEGGIIGWEYKRMSPNRYCAVVRDNPTSRRSAVRWGGRVCERNGILGRVELTLKFGWHAPNELPQQGVVTRDLNF